MGGLEVCMLRQVLTCTLRVPLSAVTRFNCLRISLFTAATCAPTRMGKVINICPELMRRVGASALYDNANVHDPQKQIKTDETQDSTLSPEESTGSMQAVDSDVIHVHLQSRNCCLYHLPHRHSQFDRMHKATIEE